MQNTPPEGEHDTVSPHLSVVDADNMQIPTSYRIASVAGEKGFVPEVIQDTYPCLSGTTWF
jgi:hypothetical protein